MDCFNVLIIGDVFARPGREVLERELPKLKERFSPALTIVNGENAAHGFGILPRMAKDFFRWGADVITTGNHVWDRREILTYIDETDRLLRPHNYPAHQPGSGFVDVDCGEDIGVIRVVNIIGRTCMGQADNPFRCVDALLKEGNPRAQNFAGIIVDFHAETTSEKTSMAQFLAGRVSGLFGTHTHVPTADARIINGTGYITDIGMTGVYNSSIGVDAKPAIGRFLEQLPKPGMEPALGEATLCGACISIALEDGLCRDIFPIRSGDILEKTYR